MTSGSRELRLRAGVTPNSAIETIERLQTELKNLIGSVPGGRPPNQYQWPYLRWVEDAERAIRNTFKSSWVWEEFYTPRYQLIHDMNKTTPRPIPMITLETEVQEERLEMILDRLKREMQPFEMPDGCVAIIPDTNVLIHCRMYDQIKWPLLVKAPSARLVLPELIIDQLDRQSYGSKQFGRRVKKVQKALSKLRGDEPPEKPLAVREMTELQVLMDPRGHERLKNEDDEILTRAQYLAAVVGEDRVVIATLDVAAQYRASNRGLRTLWMPDETRYESDAIASNDENHDE